MPAPYYSLIQLRDQILSDIESKTNQDTPAVAVAYNRIIANAAAAMALQNQLHNIDMVKECFPQTASENFGLPLWAGIVNRPREDGAKAQLQITATGTDGENIGIGTTGPRWRAPSGITYQVIVGGEISGGLVSIQIEAESFGEEGTLQVGDPVQLTTTLPGIDNTATVTAVNVSGAPQEDVETWRADIIQLAAFPPQIGTAAWFYNKALEVPGITRVYPYVSQTYPGRVEIYAVDDSQVDGQPSAAQLEQIEAITAEANQNIMWATALLPNGDKRLEAFASPVDEYEVVITDGVPNLSATMKQAIEESIEIYFMTRNPYILGLFGENQGAVETVGIIADAQNTIDARTGDTGRFIDIGLTKVGEAPAETYILEAGRRAKPTISYT